MIYSQQYYQEHKEYFKNKRKERYLKHKEEEKKKAIQWNKQNPDKKKIHNNTYYLKHKKERLLYLENNPDKLKKWRKTYYLKHRVLKGRPKTNPKLRKPLRLWTCKTLDIQVNARTLLLRAVRKNRIAKPLRCSECGKKTTPRNLHGHHRDYTIWWAVEWLCSLCHKKRHIRRSNEL